MIGSRDYFGFSTISSSCDLQKCMVHSVGFLLWWHMSLMDRFHLWYYKVSLYIDIYISSHYGGYDDDIEQIYAMIW